jgi:pectate lyase
MLLLLLPANRISIPEPMPMIASTYPQENNPTQSPTLNHFMVPAFPGVEGFGALAAGGRGGQVIEVTNLNDSGPGSFRAAVGAIGPRLVVFRVAGTIELTSSVLINSPYITIAGQTAPGGGITIRGVDSGIDTLINVVTHDVVIRYLTLRAGPPSAGDGMEIMALEKHDTYNVVIDHNSMSWAVNRNLTTWYDVHDLSIQWNIFSEGLNCSIHPKGCHSKGVLLGGYASDEDKNEPGATNISFHHNLMAHNGERNPLITTSGVVDVVNNVAYNPFWSFSDVDFQNQLTVIPANYTGNYFKAGPDTDSSKYSIDVASPPLLGAKIYVQGNIGPHRFDITQPEINIVGPEARSYIISVRNPAPMVTTTTAPEAYDQVLAGAGANMRVGCDGTFLSRRDVIDERIVNDVRNGTGKIIDDPSEGGGYLTIPPATPCTDSDHDGMPDEWEKKYDLDPQNPSDGAQDLNSDGYTNLEEYLNGTDPGKE